MMEFSSCRWTTALRNIYGNKIDTNLLTMILLWFDVSLILLVEMNHELSVLYHYTPVFYYYILAFKENPFVHTMV